MPDARVQAAIDHWAPRFRAQGVDHGDFTAVTQAIDRWDQWLDGWVAMGDTHAALARDAEHADRDLTAGEAWVRAALCYHFAKFLWFVDMDKHAAAQRRAIDALYAAHRDLDPTAERIEIPFDGATLAANLRRPAGTAAPPLVVLLPGLDSAKEEFFHWENVFLARGLATLSLDGPGQGESGARTHIRHDYEAAVSATLDRLTNRQDLARSRIGVVGVSLGGYYAPRAAAFDSRIMAVVAVGGPYNFGACWAQLPPLTREAFTYHSGSRNEAEGLQRALQLTLEGVLHEVRQPFLVVFGKRDQLIPHEQAERVAREAPRAELVLYPDGNHVCNNIAYKYRPLVADWMREHLVPPHSRGALL